jgi:hypothetical protein
VRLATTTGCLLIRGTRTSLGWRRDENSRQLSQPMIGTPNSKQNTSKRREDKTSSTFHFPNKEAREP